MEKPIQLKIEEAKNNIVDFINQECNKNEIDYYFLEIILNSIYQEVLELKNKEMNQMREEISKEISKEVNKDGLSKNYLD